MSKTVKIHIIYTLLKSCHWDNNNNNNNYYYYTVDNALVVIHYRRILSAGGHQSVSVKRTSVQFSFEWPFEMFQCTGGINRSRNSIPNGRCCGRHFFILYHLNMPFCYLSLCKIRHVCYFVVYKRLLLLLFYTVNIELMFKKTIFVIEKTFLWFVHISIHLNVSVSSISLDPHQINHICSFVFTWPSYPFSTILLHTLLPAGSAWRAALPVLFLLTGRFLGFSPHRGDTLHWSRWNLARRSGP